MIGAFAVTGYNVGCGSVLLFLAAAGYILTAGVVTLAAIGLHQLIADIDRMYKLLGLLALGNILLNLADNDMAQVAILGDDFAGSVLMLAVMATEAAGEIKVAGMRRISVPGDLHLGEVVSRIYLLYLLYRLFD